MTLRYTQINDDYRRRAVQSLPIFNLEEKSFEKSYEGEAPKVVAFAK